MAQHLNPLGNVINRGAKLFAEWPLDALQQFSRGDGGDLVDGLQKTFDMAEGDERLTPLIAERYLAQRELMSIHQRELAAAQRRRLREISTLHDLQERRARRTVADAEISDTNE